MAEESKETKESRDSPNIPKNKVLAEIVKKVAASFMPREVKPVQIRASTLEFYAKKMAEQGYEMSEASLQILCEYLKGYNLWLCGNVGVGKTFFFQCMSRIRVMRNMSPIVKLSMLETQGWTMEDAAEWVRDMIEYNVLIDDVGAEPKLNHYGEKVEVFPYLLEKRMQVSRLRTHLTSNLGPADILSRYERRVADRFVQMFKMIEMKAKKSRRKLAPWKGSENGAEVL